jgi:hypothetical protein
MVVPPVALYMRANTTSARTAGAVRQHSLTDVAVVALAVSTAAVVGMFALAYAGATVALLAGAATAWVGARLVGRLRTVVRRDRQRRRAGASVTEEA